MLTSATLLIFDNAALDDPEGDIVPAAVTAVLAAIVMFPISKLAVDLSSGSKEDTVAPPSPVYPAPPPPPRTHTHSTTTTTARHLQTGTDGPKHPANSTERRAPETQTGVFDFSASSVVRRSRLATWMHRFLILGAPHAAASQRMFGEPPSVWRAGRPAITTTAEAEARQ
jgi:hypothetical protein